MAKNLFISFIKNMMKVSFCGLKENIEYGNKAIERMKKDFPNGIKSGTYYETFVENQDPDIRQKYQDEVCKMRDIVEWKKRQGLSEREAIEIAVKQTGAGNCGEQAFLLSNRLNEMGITNKLVAIAVCSKKTKYVEDGHTFCVIDTDNPINPLKPQTWSEDAVIADMWSDTVGKASEVLEYFFEILKPNQDEQNVYFVSVQE